MKKIIFDTDIGDDIDDAFALTALLNLQDKVELIGITTVFVNTDIRARIAKKLLKLHGMDCKVYAGIRNGANNPNMDVNTKPCQYTNDLESDEYKPDNDVYTDNGMAAVDFLIQSARKYKDELTIVCVGPYSNIGNAILKDKDAFKNCRIVTMGGNFFSREFIEWNIVCDPINAKVLIESGLDVTCVGIDVTEKTLLPSNLYQEFIDYQPNEYYKYMSTLIQLHRKFRNEENFSATLHDPLALLYAIFDDYVQVKKQLIKVETKGEYTTGETVNIDYLFHYELTPRSGNRINAAYSVDENKFFNDFTKLYEKDF